MRLLRFVPVSVVTLGLLSIATAAHADQPGASPYAPYSFLVGKWNVTPEQGGDVVADQTLRWGTNQSYLWYSQNLRMNGTSEPHFEGILIWNGVHKNLDMLLEMDLRHGLTEEAGTLSLEPDGTVVREITTSYSAGVQPLGASKAGPMGTVAHFRQTYRAIAPDKVLTTVMHQTQNGWVPTFPGSDHLLMTRDTAT